MKRVWEGFPPELQLLLACVTGDAVKMAKLTTPAIDWDRFVYWAIYHRVYPIIHQKMSRLAQPVLPEAVLAALHQHSQANLRLSLALTGATVRVITALEENRISVAVLKGSLLSQRLYGDPGLRPFHDLDLLIWPDELERADRVLQDLGYRRTHPDFVVTPLRLKEYMKKAHHFNYVHQSLRAEIELHWQLRHTYLIMPLPPVETLRRIPVAGYTLPVLPDAEWFLYLILHGANHAWTTLRWLADIAEFARMSLDWDKVACLAESYGIRSLLGQGLILTEQLLSVPVPEAIRPALSGDVKAWRLARSVVELYRDMHETSGRKRRGWKWRFYLWQKNYCIQLQNGWQSKCSYIWSFWVLPEEDLRNFSLPDCIFPVYYMIRPFTWLGRRWRHFRGRNDGC